VLIAVTDVAAAARELEAHYGLASVEGGRHPAWGTANRIVPLGTSYLELIGVVDQAAAADTSVGRWVAGGASRPGRPLGWAVRTGRLEELARRLGLAVRSGSRVAPNGEVLRWRSAGIDQAAAEPSLPFFIQWGAGTRLPGTTAVAHPAAPAGISRLLLDRDPRRLTAWLGEHGLPASSQCKGPMAGRSRPTPQRCRAAVAVAMTAPHASAYDGWALIRPRRVWRPRRAGLAAGVSPAPTPTPSPARSPVPTAR
jgi:hypothetical protein